MANCNEQFLDFNDTVKLTDARKKSLKKSRKSLRERIRNYFDKNKPKEIKPKFYAQGSFELDTIVNPIPRKEKVDGEEKSLLYYDVDDGVYFIGDDEDKETVQNYHDWIFEAVSGHTEATKDKNTCVRTIFADGHNIDQPIYFMVDKDGSIPQLAHKKKDWIDSDPREFTNWFKSYSESNAQLIRIVRYLKAWCDYENFQSNADKMPTGLVMTIWAAESDTTNVRDDIAIRDVLQHIKNVCDVGVRCERPTTPDGEDLLEDYKYSDYFIGKLDKFLESAKQAINETNPKNACLKWQTHFGSRFSCSTAKDEDENARTFSSPAIIKEDAKSA